METPFRPSLLSRVRVVLIETSHPGNIGATARAMKTMGLSELVLVNPHGFPSAEATARASGADDILMRARCVSTLAEAIADCGMTLGTTARARHLEWPLCGPREAAAALRTLPDATRCALLFGREQSGLSNDELALCQQVIRIPTDETFSSLNLAQAVQICAYELRLAALAPAPVAADEPLATAQELADTVAHVARLMQRVGFLNPERPKLLPVRIRRFVNRGGLKRSEMRIMRGFCTAVEEALEAPRDGR